MNINRKLLNAAQLAELAAAESAPFTARREQVSFYGTYLDDDLGTNWGDNFAGWNSTPMRGSRAEVEKDLSVYTGKAKRIWQTATLTLCIDQQASEA